MMMGGEAAEKTGTCEALLAAGRQFLWRQKLLHTSNKKRAGKE
jgi:hypothetical protein